MKPWAEEGRTQKSLGCFNQAKNDKTFACGCFLLKHIYINLQVKHNRPYFKRANVMTSSKQDGLGALTQGHLLFWFMYVQQSAKEAG